MNSFQFETSVMIETLPLLLEGARLTLWVTLLGCLFGFLLGGAIGVLRSLENPWARRPAGFYIEIIRGLMVQVMFLYFALPMALGIRFPPIAAGVIAIALNSGAYIAEVVRGAIAGVPRGQPTIEEDVQACIERFLNFANAVLTHIDPTNRLSHCVLAATMLNAGAAGWRTRAEHAASPNNMTLNIQNDGEMEAVSLSPPHRTRSALRLNTENLAEDLTVKLRRALQNPRREPW